MQPYDPEFGYYAHDLKDTLVEQWEVQTHPCYFHTSGKDGEQVEATLVDTALVARRVLGASHPLTRGIEQDLRKSRDTLAEMLAARESGAASG